MTASAHIPDAWPQLLTREQLCAYLGGLSWDTVKKILPVSPLDLGANVLRYSRPQVDDWIARCPPRAMNRLPEPEQPVEDDGAVDLGQDELRVTSLDRVRQRAQQGQGRWKKTG